MGVYFWIQIEAYTLPLALQQLQTFPVLACWKAVRKAMRERETGFYGLANTLHMFLVH